MSETFQRNIEDFDCEHCGAHIKGSGYTNHCSRCLWSKHVDVYPGDREADCGGLMEPVRVETRRNSHVIVHRCITCGHEHPNKILEGDNFEVLLQISEDLSRGIGK